MYERRQLTPLGALILSLIISLFAVGEALAFLNTQKPEDEIGGAVTARIGDRQFYFPILKSDISANIEGDLANITVVQTFLNSTDLPLNATYLFPLNKDAAVHFMQMEIGDERITAVIKKKPEARAIYESAKQQGKAAALLDQHRPNMFTQELANLMPGKPVKVTLKYAMTVPRIDGAYELVVPLVVGPRFTPKKAPTPQMVLSSEEIAPTPEPPKSGEWNFAAPPVYPHVSGLSIPDTVAKDRVSIHVDLKAAFAIQNVTSATHQLAIAGETNDKIVTLASGRTIDNRDFVLRYELSGRSVEAGLLAHYDERGQFFSLLLEPPKTPLEKDITPREMVFVLDTSGSMSGAPMEASKTFMRQAIKSLRSDDFFRIIRFSSDTGEFSNVPVQASLLNKMAGIKYVNSLRAGGGTRVPAAIERAFAVPQQAGALRIVTFLSDGYIGNEARVLNLIATQIGSARIYAFGVGTSVNRFLLAEMARAGRGYARFIDPTENTNDVAVELANRLEAPVLTDIKVDWGTLKPFGIIPHKIPDLFKGDSLRLMARSSEQLAALSAHNVIVTGRVNGRAATMPLKLMIPQSKGRESALPVIWARTRIADHMRTLTTPHQMRKSGISDEQLTGLVTKLGLEFSLMTQWTSFVAVSQKIANESPQETVDTSVPLNQVKGVLEHAYERKQGAQPMRKAQIINQPTHMQNLALNGIVGSQQNFGFGGSSTPEPGTIGAMLLLVLMMLTAMMWSKRRAV